MFQIVMRKSPTPTNIETVYYGSSEIFRIVYRTGVDDALLDQMRQVCEQLPSVLVSITASNARRAPIQDDFVVGWQRRISALDLSVFTKLAVLISVYEHCPTSKFYFGKSPARDQLLQHADIAATMVINLITGSKTETNVDFSYWSAEHPYNYVSSAYFLLLDGVAAGKQLQASMHVCKLAQVNLNVI